MIIDVPKIHEWNLIKLQINDNVQFIKETLNSNNFEIQISDFKIKFKFTDTKICDKSKEKIEENLIGSSYE